MKEVFVYVEGPSDQVGMRKLMTAIIERSSQVGNKVDFFPLGGKDALLNKGPIKAINILRNRPNSWVFLLPDLYPENRPFRHSSYEELKREIDRRFSDELRRKNCDERLKNRFVIHCFKHDLEVLLLASNEILMRRLGIKKFSCTWVNPVENQDLQKPPKRIVESLFKDAGFKYKDTYDAPWVLERADYKDLMGKCPQNFKPFLEDLLRILEME